MPTTEDIASHLYLVFVDHLPFCGCGDPADGYRLVHRLLTLAPFYENGRWRQVEEACGTPGATQLVVAAITGAELLEHGSSQAGSWLTDRGRWVLWAVQQIDGIEKLDACLDGVGYPHDGQPDCTDTCWTFPDDPRTKLRPAVEEEELPPSE